MDSRYASVQGLTAEIPPQPRSTFSKCFWQADGQMICQSQPTPEGSDSLAPVRQFDTFSQPNEQYNNSHNMNNSVGYLSFQK